MKYKYKKGQSLFEVVLAIAVVTLITVGIIILATNSIRNSTYSKNKTLASKYAQEGIEWVRDQRATDPTTFYTNVNVPTFCISDLTWDNPGSCSDFYIGTTNLYREITFSVSDLNGKTSVYTVVTVYWDDSQGQHQAKAETTLVDTR